MSFLSWLLEGASQPFGTSTTNEQLYECSCGAPMENTGAYSKGSGETRYCVESWECTDKECQRMAQAYIFVKAAESYGEGCLSGQVEGRSL